MTEKKEPIRKPVSRVVTIILTSYCRNEASEGEFEIKDYSELGVMDSYSKKNKSL